MGSNPIALTRNTKEDNRLAGRREGAGRAVLGAYLGARPILAAPKSWHHPRHVIAGRRLEAAGVEFIPENGGGAGVRLKKS
ncbi:transcriptional regulator [Mesorhizobium sp.]|uniref:transcriptional regulator n=1 Tax=Mesorhizobium sp. TaxID=1871066 RepID=UPI000FE4D15F|nr:transcriptional regulator [Mesorhizobium sp.]RWD94520.1 MAG: transcriptional regulator [Mesorhizobium sp.]TIV49108.1 MAG: transcriptional regulator [Mesorhizobium sp.]